MMHEIVYIESRTHTDRQFVMDMTLLARQKSGETCAVISEAHVEMHALSHRRGVDVSRVLFSNPSSTQQAREILESLVRFGSCNLVIIEGFLGLMTPSFLLLIEDLASQTETSILLAR